MHTIGGKPAYIESGARSHMVSQYSVNEQRGSVYIYVLCTTGLSLYFNIINGRLEASGIESVLVCLPVFPPQLVLSDQDFPQSTGGGRLGQENFNRNT